MSAKYFLSNYKMVNYRLETTELEFKLFDDSVAVRSTISGQFCEGLQPEERFIELNGSSAFSLTSLTLNGKLLKSDSYETTGEDITIRETPKEFVIEVKSSIQQVRGGSLYGIFQCEEDYCTYCEPEGFRRITLYPDRPDVSSLFTVTIYADKKKYPTLLSNGNLIDSGEDKEGVHWVKYCDAFRKPCYLFALVAGNYHSLSDHYMRSNKTQVSLKIYIHRAKSLQVVDHAMKALKAAMKWDQEFFGLEYDLDEYSIAAIDWFNIGGMENKGLNIFNSNYLIASKETSTDAELTNIFALIAHEYFHNWTGNRIFCKNWFHTTIKEGLTVFREILYRKTLCEEGISRIYQAKFIQDSVFFAATGPLSHPVVVSEYVDPSDYFDSIVYYMGAEIFHMIYLIVGEEEFISAFKAYIKKFDQTHVCVEDFLETFSSELNRDFRQFKLWFYQSGVPELDIHTQYDAENGKFVLRIEQKLWDTCQNRLGKPMHIPLMIGFVNDIGNFSCLGEKCTKRGDGKESYLLEIKEKSETFEFSQVKEKPILSLQRYFSAPVKINYHYSKEELYYLLEHDRESYSLWNSSQMLLSKIIGELVDKIVLNQPLEVEEELYTVLNKALRKHPGELMTLILTLPREISFLDKLFPLPVDSIIQARSFLRNEIAKELRETFLELYLSLSHREAHCFSDITQLSKRALKNCCLSYLMIYPNDELYALSREQYERADNMTDKYAVLFAMKDDASPQQRELIDNFFTHWKENSLVLNKWIRLNSMRNSSDTLEILENIGKLDQFNWKNPEHVYSLLAEFAFNFPQFHRLDGKGYRFFTDKAIEVSKYNEAVAFRLIQRYELCKKIDMRHRQLLLKEIERFYESPHLTGHLRETLYHLINK